MNRRDGAKRLQRVGRAGVALGVLHGGLAPPVQL